MNTTDKISLTEFNQSNEQMASETLLRCCSSQNWVKGMIESRPFSSIAGMCAKSSSIWFSLKEEDYLQAFDAHPKIGDISSLKEKYAKTKAWASGEQSGAAIQDEQILQELKLANDEYFQKHGFIFIIYATGKTAPEMLQILKNRLPNDRTAEIRNAAVEQDKITRLRIEKGIYEDE